MAEKTPCEDCGGKCCRYFALEIDKPKSKGDFDDIRWFLCHENTRIFVEDGGWYLEVQTVCRHLDENDRCRIYPKRPRLCRSHSTDICEGQDAAEWDRKLELNDDAELERYLEQRKKKAKKKAKKKRGKAQGQEDR